MSTRWHPDIAAFLGGLLNRKRASMNKRLRETTITALIVIGFVSSAVAQPISVVPYTSIGPNRVDFDDVPGAPFPPFPAVVFDEILISGNASFAERFVGQTLSIGPRGPGLAGPLDELSGVPSDPLTLQVGDPFKNLAVLRRGEPPTNELFPCGNLTCRLLAGQGEGAFALIFPAPVSAFGFISSGGDPGGDIVVQFFRADGTLIAAVTVVTELDPAVGRFGFMREDGIKDIAGVSIHTTDPAGLGYDDFVFGDVDLSISCTPTLLDSASSATCTIGTQDGLDDPVTLSCESLPAGADCNFSQDEVILAVPGSTDVELSMAVDDTVPESFSFQVVGTSGTVRGTFEMSFEESKTIPPVPQAPPMTNDITFTAENISTGCQFRSAGPIAFEIEVTRVVAEVAELNTDGTLKNASELVAADVLSPTATLQLIAFDVDRNTQPPPGSVPEIDRVFFNGEEIGTLDGENNLWQLNEFEIPIEKVRFPKRAGVGSKPTGVGNEIRVEIDTDNGKDTWCTAVNWSALSFKAISPILLIHGNDSDPGFFDRRGFTSVLTARDLLFDGCEACPNPIELPTTTTQNNGRVLNEDKNIPGIVKSLGVDSVHLVAHSKGGLDAREYLAMYQPGNDQDFKILSLTTLSTPHNGSVGADFLVQRDIALTSAAEIEFVGFPRFTERVSDRVKQNLGHESLQTTTSAVFNITNTPGLPAGRFFNTVAADADGNSNGEIDRDPDDEYAELRAEVERLRLLDRDPLFGREFGRTIVSATYQIQSSVGGVNIGTRTERTLLGRTRKVAVLTAIRRAPVGNDIVVTIPSALGEGFIAPRTMNTVTFMGNRGPNPARNHASVADGGVALTVVRWILNVEQMRGDLK